MLILRSREEAAGSKTGREHDFHHTREGELLTLVSLVCEGSEEYRIRCGCGRSWSGTESGRACTVGVVDELDDAAAKALLRESELVSGWAKDWNEAEAFEAFWDDFQRLAAALEEAHEDGAVDVGGRVRCHNGEGTFELIVNRKEQP
jgi:hypothetical protein